MATQLGTINAGCCRLRPDFRCVGNRTQRHCACSEADTNAQSVAELLMNCWTKFHIEVTYQRLEKQLSSAKSGYYSYTEHEFGSQYPN